MTKESENAMTRAGAFLVASLIACLFCAGCRKDPLVGKWQCISGNCEGAVVSVERIGREYFGRLVETPTDPELKFGLGDLKWRHVVLVGTQGSRSYTGQNLVAVGIDSPYLDFVMQAKPETAFKYGSRIEYANAEVNYYLAETHKYLAGELRTRPCWVQPRAKNLNDILGIVDPARRIDPSTASDPGLLARFRALMGKTSGLRYQFWPGNWYYAKGYRYMPVPWDTVASQYSQYSGQLPAETTAALLKGTDRQRDSIRKGYEEAEARAMDEALRPFSSTSSFWPRAEMYSYGWVPDARSPDDWLAATDSFGRPKAPENGRALLRALVRTDTVAALRTYVYAGNSEASEERWVKISSQP